MEKSRQRAYAEAFRSLHGRPNPLLLANVWDALSARIVEQAGYEAVATTSGGLNWVLGYPDGEVAPWSEVVAATARIARVLNVPLTADIEMGYGATPDDVAKNVADIIGAGAVGINLEDGSKSAKSPLRNVDDMTARIRAARTVAQQMEIPIVINARVDVFHRQAGDTDFRFAEAVRRAEAYVRAGADCIFFFGLANADTIGRLTKAVTVPVNVVGRPGMPDVETLARLGVRRISAASGLAMIAIDEVQRVVHELRASGSFGVLVHKSTRAEIQELFAGERP